MNTLDSRVAMALEKKVQEEKTLVFATWSGGMDNKNIG